MIKMNVGRKGQRVFHAAMDFSMIFCEEGAGNTCCIVKTSSRKSAEKTCRGEYSLPFPSDKAKTVDKNFAMQ